MFSTNKLTRSCRNLWRSLTIIVEGVVIAIGAVVLIILVIIPFGAAGLVRWSCERIVDAWVSPE